MDNNLLLDNLDSISNINVYSRKNREYEKILGNYTLKSFIKSIKNPIKIKKKNFLDEMAIKYPYDEDPSFKISQSLNKKIVRSKELFNNIINDYIETDNNKNDSKNPIRAYQFRKPIKIDLTPNPCTYNPKYDCIFKRIPVVTIYKTPKKIDDNNNNTNNFSIKRKIKLKKITNDKKHNIILYRNNKEKKKLDSLQSFNKKFISFTKNNDYLKEEINDNNQKEKIISFRNKDSIIKNNNEKSNNNNSNNNNINNNFFNLIHKNRIPYNNNINNFNKRKRKHNSVYKNILKTCVLNKFNDEKNYTEKKNVIDFNKMLSRNYDIILNTSSLKNPSFYYYKPNFEYITQSLKGFNFGEKPKKTNSEKKKFLLKKMWCSYGDLSKDYYLVNNSKLNNNKDK